jgi:hypothetical protein
MFTTIGAALLGVKNIVNGKKVKAKEEPTSPEPLNS